MLRGSGKEEVVGGGGDEGGVMEKLMNKLTDRYARL